VNLVVESSILWPDVLGYVLDTGGLIVGITSDLQSGWATGDWYALVLLMLSGLDRWSMYARCCVFVFS
jgi:hypothetical protein